MSLLAECNSKRCYSKRTVPRFLRGMMARFASSVVNDVPYISFKHSYANHDEIFTISKQIQDGVREPYCIFVAFS